MRLITGALALALALILASCAPTAILPTVDSGAAQREAYLQQEIAIEAFVDNLRRLYFIGGKILEANADLCGERSKPEYGFALANRDYFPQDYWLAAYTLYGLDQSARVGLLLPDSPAAASGIVLGDHVLALDGEILPDGVALYAAYAKMLEEAEGKPVMLDLMDRRVAVAPIRICDYDMLLLNDIEVTNALADGDRIYVTGGMMRFAQAKEELAFVHSHELAHNVMGHAGKKAGNILLGSLVDVLIAATTGVQSSTFGQVGALVYSQEFEAEADYMGLYLMARAGYDISEAPKFWRRMATLSPAAINHATTHPTTPERFVAMGSAVEEILGKTATGVALMPNLASEIKLKKRKPAAEREPRTPLGHKTDQSRF